MNASIRAQNLIEVLEDLIDVLERENAMLDRPRAHDLKPVVEEKQALFKLYNDQIAEIATDSSFLGDLPDDIRDQLKQLAEAFEKTMAKNRRKLEILTRSSQQIVDCIVDAAKKAAGHVPHYGRAGSVAKEGAAAPVAMNQEI
ncbi:MAG: hypothetical protein RIM33_08335 [Alphaproteobacteria bacterium]